VKSKRRQRFQYVNPALCTVGIYTIPSKAQLAHSWEVGKSSTGLIFHSSTGRLTGYVTLLDSIEPELLRIEFITAEGEIWQVKWQTEMKVGEAYSPTLYRKLVTGH
jgi:hypothetical protein